MLFLDKNESEYSVIASRLGVASDEIASVVPAGRSSLIVCLNNGTGCIVEFVDPIVSLDQPLQVKTVKQMSVPKKENQSTFPQLPPAKTVQAEVQKEAVSIKSENGLLFIPGLDGENVRVSPCGKWISVYDLIRVVCKIANPHQLWGGDKSSRKTRQKGLVERYPEVLRNTDNLKFPGKGQRETPVINRQGTLELMQVLPGEVGAKFRKEAAQMIIRYLDGDTTLADEIIDRAEDKGKTEDIERHIVRSQSIVARKQFTAACHRHGVRGAGYPQVTDAIHKGFTGKDTAALRQERGLKPKDNFREKGATIIELAAFTVIETAAANGFKECNAYGNEECAMVAQDAATAIAKIMQGKF